MKCKECGVAMRPRQVSADEMPGTKIHSGHGLCATDYHAARNALPKSERARGSYEPRPSGHRPTVAALLAERDRFAAARRARGVPVEGIRGTRNRIPVDA